MQPDRAGKCYRYQTYGLRLSAAFPLACLEEARYPGPGDVRLVLGEIPPELPGARSSHGDGESATTGRFLLHHPRASFFIEDESLIRFPHAFAACTGEDQWFPLHVALAHLLRLRGCVFFHASAVERHGRAYAFLGPGSSGKSTTAAALTLKGYRPLADDVCALAFTTTGEPLVLPGYHRQDLRPEAVTRLGLDAGGLTWSAQAGKYVRRFPPESMPAAASLARIYVLSPDASPKPILKRMDGIERLRALVESGQHPNGYHERGYLMGRLAAIAGSIQFKTLKRPRNGEMFEASLALLDQDIRDGE